MQILRLIADFVGGAFLVNAVPHLVAGLMGEAFQTPFAKPRGKGLSSSRVNVLWSFANLLFAWLLLSQVGDFDPYAAADGVSAGLGGLLMGLVLAHLFGPLHGGGGGGAAD